MNRHSIPAIFLILLPLALFFSLAAFDGVFAQQNGYDQFQKALAKERGEGDLEGAIALYLKVVEEAKDEALAAKAQYRIGLCYEKLGKQEAQKAFQKVIDNYPTQHETVKAAREKLSSLLKPQYSAEKANSGFNMHPIWSDRELKRLPDKGIGIGNPRPSPDGKYISFIDWSSGFGDLYIQEKTGGNLKCLTKRSTDTESMANAYDSRWSLDGRFLAYIWENDEKNYVDLRVIGLTDVKPRMLLRGSYAEGWISPLDWSPDGKNILAKVNGDNKIQFGLVPLDGGALQIIKTFPDLEPGNSPGGGLFSLDGRYIAYDSQQGKDVVNHDVYLLDIESRKERVVAPHPSHDYLLGWSPGDDTLVFASDRAGTVDLWTISVQDGQPAGKPSLAIKNMGFIDPLGITDEGTLYFNRNSDGISMNIYTAAFDPDSGLPESPPEKLALPYEGGNIFPDWSPDGRTLAYVSRRKPPGRGILCLYSNGSGRIREISFPHMISDPCWSKDSRYLFVIDWNAHNIFRIDIETANIQTLIEGEDVYSPAISPDMNFLFYASRDKKAQNTCIMKKDLKSGSEMEIYRTSWIISDLELSPSGRRVAVVLSEKPYGPGPSGESKNILGIIPSSGGDINTVHEFVQPAGSGLVEIAWSPDGRHIIFSKSESDLSQEEWPELWELWRVPAEGGEAQDLGLKMKRFRSLSIHPDGHQIAFFSHGSGDKQPPSFWVIENFLPKETEQHRFKK